MSETCNLMAESPAGAGQFVRRLLLQYCVYNERLIEDLSCIRPADRRKRRFQLYLKAYKHFSKSEPCVTMQINDLRSHISIT